MKKFFLGTGAFWFVFVGFVSARTYPFSEMVEREHDVKDSILGWRFAKCSKAPDQFPEKPTRVVDGIDAVHEAQRPGSGAAARQRRRRLEPVVRARFLNRQVTLTAEVSKLLRELRHQFLILLA